MEDYYEAVSESESLRPYEKCMQMGAQALTDTELLAVIMRTGTQGMDAIQLADKILSDCRGKDGLLNLMNASVPELMRIRGVGKVKAVQMKCICELSRRIAKTSACMRLDFSSPRAIAEYYMEDLRHLDRERMILVLLDSKCGLLHDMVLSVGTVNSSLVTPREVMIEALHYGAVSFVILHNHPSGDPEPSSNDRQVTDRLYQAGNLLGITLLDHIIIGNHTFCSFKERNLIS